MAQTLRYERERARSDCIWIALCAVRPPCPLVCHGLRSALTPPKSKRATVEREADDTYVIERFITHARDDEDACWLIRVRWAAYSADEDTWEPATELPEDMVRRYERRKKLPEGLLTRAEPPVIEQRPFVYENGLKKRV